MNITVMPTRKGALLKGAALLERELAIARGSAVVCDSNGHSEAERLVLHATELSASAAILRELANDENPEVTRTVRA